MAGVDEKQSLVTVHVDDQANVETALIPSAPPTDKRIILLRMVNGVIVVFSVPYVFYNIPLSYAALTDLFESFIPDATTVKVISGGLTGILSATGFVQDTLRLNIAENIEWALSKTTTQTQNIKINIPTHLLRLLAIIAYSLDSTRDLQPLAWLFGNSVAYACTVLVIPAYIYYSLVLYDDRLITACNKLPDLFSRAYKELCAQPAITLETIVIVLSLTLNKFISSGAILVQLWADTPTALLYISMTNTGFISLLARSITTIQLHHNAEQFDVRYLQRVKRSSWEWFRFINLSLLRGVPIAILAKMGTKSWFGMLLGLPFAAHVFYVNYKLHERIQASRIKQKQLSRLLTNQAVADKQVKFEQLRQKLDSSSLALVITFQNLLVNFLQLCLTYGASNLLLPFFGITASNIVLGCVSLLVTTPMLAASADTVAEDVKKTITTLLAKEKILKKQNPRSSSCASFLKLFCWQSKQSLLIQTDEKCIDECFEVISVTPATPMMEITATPVHNGQRLRSSSISGAASGYATMWQQLPPPMVVAVADVKVEPPQLSCSERFWKCLGW